MYSFQLRSERNRFLEDEIEYYITLHYITAQLLQDLGLPPLPH